MKKIGFIFPGQGSQYTGMGKEFYDQFRVAREVFEEADDSLSFSISNICFQGSEEELKLTENTQPAVLTVSIAILRVLEEEVGLEAEISAGHSLGEYSALVNSGSLKFSDAVRIVRLRGRFMQDAVPLGEGAMAAILGMDRQEVEILCKEVKEGEVVSPANFNCPGQIVIAGHTKAIERAIEKVKQNGKKAILLSVSAPFHSPLMKPAGMRLEEALREITVNELKIPVVANLDAEINTSKERVKPLLVAQVSNPVRWEESIKRMIEEGVESFIEIGPGKVLTGLVKRIEPGVEAMNVEDIKTLKKLSL